MRTFGDLTIGDIIYKVEWFENKLEVKPYQIVYIDKTINIGKIYDKDYILMHVVDISDFNIRHQIVVCINQSELSGTFQRWFIDDKECFDFYDSISNCKIKR